MAELARNYGQGPISLAEVCRAEDMSLSYLEQVILPLRRAGLVLSRRGARGGYALARRPDRITVGDVIRALEGALVQVPCLNEQAESHCIREGICPTRSVWVEVRRKLVESLDSMTLADLVQSAPADVCSSLAGAHVN